MGDLSGLKGTQSNTLCSGFVDKTLSWGFWKLFPTGTYAIIGTTCVEFENVMKSTTKKKCVCDCVVLFISCFSSILNNSCFKYFALFAVNFFVTSFSFLMVCPCQLLRFVYFFFSGSGATQP